MPEPERGAANIDAWAPESPPKSAAPATREERSSLEAEAKSPPTSNRIEINGVAGRGRRREAQRWTAFGGVAAVAAKRRNGATIAVEEKREPGRDLPIPRGINRLSRKLEY